ncbi:MAG: copper resistance system multicopper oxidase [Methylococcales bacterium]
MINLPFGSSLLNKSTHKDRLSGFSVWVFLALFLGNTVVFGAVYELTIAQGTIKLNDGQQTTLVANRSLPAPTLHWREGEWVTLKVTNHLSEPTSLHWHGIILPYQMDGVPNISFSGIAPGETFTYHFQVNQSGTYWYHGHSGTQEQLGLYGAIIIDPVQQTELVQQDYVVLLSDFPEADPERTLARLKKQSDYYNFQKRTVFTLWEDIQRLGFFETLGDRLDWGDMRMEPTDIADVTGATYTFLINGQPPQQNWLALFKLGEKVRLRFINASAMTHFDIRIPGLKMRVVEADGQAVVPTVVDEFRIAVAETYNVIVEPAFDQAYSIFAEAMDRSGYASATLTPRSGLQPVLPKLRPMQLLTMADMGVGRAEHSQHDQNHSAQGLGSTEQHSGHQPIIGNSAMPQHDMHSMHKMHDMEGMHDMSAMTAPPATDPYKVLSYSDLHAAQASAAWGKVDHEITLRLTGNMHRYIWSFDDIKYGDAEPIRVHLGDHLRFNYVNETMMNHPIHIHGLWQFLDNGQGLHNPKKHVINVKPGTRVSVDVLADAVGEWAFHCHLMYHMETGMFRKLIIESPQ